MEKAQNQRRPIAYGVSEESSEISTDVLLQGGGVNTLFLLLELLLLLEVLLLLEQQKAHLPLVVVNARFAWTFGENIRGIDREDGEAVAEQHFPEKNCPVCVEPLSHSVTLGFAGVKK